MDAITVSNHKLSTLQELISKYHEGIEKIPLQYQSYLDLTAQMPEMGLVNTAIVFSEQKKVSFFATYQEFQEYGRQVKSKEKSLKLLRVNIYSKSVDAALKEVVKNMEYSYAKIGRYQFVKNVDGTYTAENCGNGHKNLCQTKTDLRYFLKNFVLEREFDSPAVAPVPVFDVGQTVPAVINKDENGKDIIHPNAFAFEKFMREQHKNMTKVESIEEIKLMYECVARTSRVPIDYEEKRFLRKRVEGIHIKPGLTPLEALKKLIEECIRTRMEENSLWEKKSIAYIIFKRYGIIKDAHQFKNEAMQLQSLDSTYLKTHLKMVHRESLRFMQEIDHELAKNIDINKNAVFLNNAIFYYAAQEQVTYYAAEIKDCCMAGKYYEDPSLEKIIVRYQSIQESQHKAIGAIHHGKRVLIFPSESHQFLPELLQRSVKICKEMIKPPIRMPPDNELLEDTYMAYQVNVKILKVKEEYQSSYTEGYEQLQASMKKIHIEKYDIVASFTMDVVPDVRKLPAMVYKLGNLTDDLQKYALPGVSLKDIGVSDILQFTKSEHTFSFFVDKQKFYEIPDFMQNIDTNSKDYQRFQTLFRVDAKLGLSSVSKKYSLLKNEINLLPLIEPEILQLPSNDSELKSYIENGKNIAAKIMSCLKENSTAIQVVESKQTSMFQKGEIFGPNEAEKKYKEFNIQKHIETYELKVSLFHKERNQIRACSLEIKLTQGTFKACIDHALDKQKNRTGEERYGK